MYVVGIASFSSNDYLYCTACLLFLKRICKLTRNTRLEGSTYSSKCVRQCHKQGPFPCRICGNILLRYEACTVQDQPSPHLQED